MAGKILIVDSVSTNRILLKVKLSAACYQTIQAASGTEALDLVKHERPNLVLVERDLPDIDGLAVCERIASDLASRAVPVIVVTAGTDVEDRVRALRAGASDVFSKPIDEIVLLARIRSLLRGREAADELGLRTLTYREFGFADAQQEFARPARVAVVAGTSPAAFRWMRTLKSGLPDRVSLMSAEEAMGEWAGNTAPDVFVIAADLGSHGDGLRLMSEIRSRHATRFAGVCIVLSVDAHDTAAMALDLGANDLIQTDVAPEEMVHRVRQQIEGKRQTDRLRATLADGLRMAMIDPLTGLHNRRYALPHLGRIADLAGSAGRRFAVMLMDLDRFKTINDTHGHAAGDAVLVEVAERFRNNLRAVDLVARFGGEEFLVALPDTSLEAARSTAERLRRVIEATPIRLPNGCAARITMSVGLAMGGNAAPSPRETIEHLLDRADRALLSSKSDGRNQVTVSRSAA